MNNNVHAQLMRCSCLYFVKGLSSLPQGACGNALLCRVHRSCKTISPESESKLVTIKWFHIFLTRFVSSGPGQYLSAEVVVVRLEALFPLKCKSSLRRKRDRRSFGLADLHASDQCQIINCAQCKIATMLKCISLLYIDTSTESHK